MGWIFLASFLSVFEMHMCDYLSRSPSIWDLLLPIKDKAFHSMYFDH